MESHCKFDFFGFIVLGDTLYFYICYALLFQKVFFKIVHLFSPLCLTAYACRSTYLKVKLVQQYPLAFTFINLI